MPNQLLHHQHAQTRFGMHPTIRNRSTFAGHRVAKRSADVFIMARSQTGFYHTILRGRKIVFTITFFLKRHVAIVRSVFRQFQLLENDKYLYMKAHKFTNISIRGRMAFAILCFQNTLMFFKENGSSWKIIIDKFWKFTSTEYLDVWFSEINECDPYGILEDVSIELKGFRFLTDEQYIHVHALYKNTNPTILSFIGHMINLGDANLQGEKINKLNQNFYSLQYILDILNEFEIELPQFQIVQKFEFDYRNGYGRRFNSNFEFTE